MEEGKWSKQSYNQNELRRVNYIKEKKDKQREDQLKQKGGDEIAEEEEDDERKPSKKRELKSNKNKQQPDDNLEPVEEIKKGKNFYKNKK
jgi:hypothetical protein